MASEVIMPLQQRPARPRCVLTRLNAPERPTVRSQGKPNSVAHDDKSGVAFAAEGNIDRLVSEVELLRQEIGILRQSNGTLEDLREGGRRRVTPTLAMPGVALDQRGRNELRRSYTTGRRAKEQLAVRQTTR